MSDKDKDSPAKPQSSTERPVKIPLDFEDALKGLLETEPEDQDEDQGGAGSRGKS